MFFCFFLCTMFIVCYALFYKYIYLPNKINKINIVYRKLYKHIENKERITSLCIVMKSYLSKEELNIIYNHFHSQKPTSKINKEFYNNIYFTGGIFWWKYHCLNKEDNFEYTHQRKLFILKMIKITNPKT